MTIILIFFGFAGFLGYCYNRLVKLKNQVLEAWSGIEVQMKRRYNLIPNLVATVKGYAKHEGDTLERVIQARNTAMETTGTPHEQAVAENMLAGTLKSLFALSESYPDLKANQNFLELQQELTDTEDKIQTARTSYNTNVLEFNIKIEQFPSLLIAKMFHFEKKDFFELEATEIAAKKPVAVNFSPKEPKPTPSPLASTPVSTVSTQETPKQDVPVPAPEAPKQEKTEIPTKAEATQEKPNL